MRQVIPYRVSGSLTIKAGEGEKFTGSFHLNAINGKEKKINLQNGKASIEGTALIVIRRKRVRLWFVTDVEGRSIVFSFDIDDKPDLQTSVGNLRKNYGYFANIGACATLAYPN
jgi:hypothetical protein